MWMSVIGELFWSEQRGVYKIYCIALVVKFLLLASYEIPEIFLFCLTKVVSQFFKVRPLIKHFIFLQGVSQKSETFTWNFFVYDGRSIASKAYEIVFSYFAESLLFKF